MSDADYSHNVARFTGFAPLYDRYRPSPPAVLGDLLTRMAQTPRPELVVDLGCGTGLSTRYWAERAERVIGIEPTPSMIDQAIELGAENVTFAKGLSHATGLPDACAEIVTCSQSLHWMNPLGTFKEVARILKPGGVFAAFDYDWPPATGFWKLDALYLDCIASALKRETHLSLDRGLQRWDKDTHLARMQHSGVFRHTRELAVHHTDRGDAARLVGLLLSQGHIQTLLKNGVSEHELGIDRLREAATKALGSHAWSWLWTSRVRLGIV